MGGAHETVVPAAAKGGSSVTAGNLRVHENGGEIHFHDDQQNLKTAVPVADWWNIWGRIANGGRSHFVDTVNKTVLDIRTKIRMGGKVQVTLKISQATFGPGYQELASFTQKVS